MNDERRSKTDRLKFICPSGHPLEASSDESGQVMKCPECGQPTLVPGDTSPSPSEEETVASDVASSSSKIGFPQIKTSSKNNDNEASDSIRADSLLIKKSSWEEEEEIIAQDDPLRRCIPPTELVRNARHMTPALLGLILVAFGPSALYVPWTDAPNWSRAAPMLALLEIAYVLWMSITPDYSTLRSTAIMFFIGAALSCVLAVTLIVYPSDSVVPFGLDEVRSSGTAWCFVAALLHFLGGYLSLQLGRKWRSIVEKRWERAIKSS